VGPCWWLLTSIRGWPLQILRHSQIAMTMEVHSEVLGPDSQRTQAPGQAARWLALLLLGAVEADRKASHKIATGL